MGVDDMIRGYIDSAIQDFDYMSRDQVRKALGHAPTVRDVDNETLEYMGNDAAFFYDRFNRSIDAGVRASPSREANHYMAGWDFWTARNAARGFGAGGFESDDWGARWAEALAKGARTFVGYMLFVADDKRIHGRKA